MRCLPSSLLFFFFGDVPIWLAHHSKKKKQCRLPKTESSILNCTVPPLWPTYIGERRTPFSKAYQIKVRRYGENVGENIGNPLGTWKEHSAKTLGSREKWKKISLAPHPSPLPPQNIKGKKQGTLSACLAFPIACMKCLFPKNFVTIFGMG